MSVKYRQTYFRFTYLDHGILKTTDLDEEPIGWDKVEIICDRDINYFGFNYEYISGDTELEFDKYSGVDIIDSVYNQYGNDGYILFSYGYKIGLVYTAEYTGKINLNTKKKFIEKDDIRIKCTVETFGKHQQIKTRIDTQVNLWDTKTIDNTDLSASLQSSLNLKSSNINRHTSFTDVTYNKSETSIYDFAQGTEKFWFMLTLQNSNQTVNDVKDFLGSQQSIYKKTDIEQESATVTNPYFPLSFMDVKEDGSYVFNFDVSYQIELNNDESGIGGDFYQVLLKTFIKINDTETQIDSKVLYDNSEDPISHVSSAVHVTYTGTHTLVSGDKVYLYQRIDITGNGAGETSLYFTEKKRVFSVSVTSTAEDSTSNGFFLIDAGNKILESITGTADLLVSDYLAREEDKYNYAILNGFSARNSEVTNAFNLSFNTYIKSLKAILGLGIGYEFDYSGNQKVRIDPYWYFFQNHEILRLTNISNYSEEIATEFIFNEIEVGYNKYPDDTNEALDEYNTKLEFTTPITTNKNRLSLLADFVASNYALEETRRFQFTNGTSTKEGTSYDESIFIISVKDLRDVPYLGNIGVTESTENITPSNISNIGDLFNLRITPKRNLYRWAKWINSGLWKKGNTQLIKNTVFTKNGLATTEAVNSEDETLTQGSIVEKADIQLSNFENRAVMFEPTWINLTAQISIDELRLIKDSMTGRNSSKKYGYISFVNENGDVVEGWLWNMKYNKQNEKVTFKFLKKRTVSTNNYRLTEAGGIRLTEAGGNRIID